MAGLLFSVLVSPGASQSPAGRTMALTFDDLPFADRLSEEDGALANAQVGTAEILRVLAAHRAPATAFVTGAKLEGPAKAERAALLGAWAAAGAVLGNHTFSHPDLNATEPAAFEADITRNETVLADFPVNAGEKFFRHPFTHSGDTPAKKERIDRFLSQRGYRIAPHTIENADYIFNAVLMEARTVDDPALVQRTLLAYVDFTMQATEYAERAARELFGRDIPQVLLLHANDINCDALDELLTRFERRGYRFVTLDAAMADAAYRTPDTYVGATGPTWLRRWTQSLGRTLSAGADPEPPQWVLDSYGQSTKAPRRGSGSSQ